jgi:hypothetical protein
MNTRCKPGDLAVILYDVPSCIDNMGRVVAISGPLDINSEDQLTWIIQPVTPEPYMINDRHGDFLRFMGYQESGIEHPDEWMMPLRPEVEEDTTEVEKIIVEETLIP